MQIPSDAAAADLACAVALHEAGRLHDAETIYRALLARRPLDPVVRNLLGLVAYQSGHAAVAAALHRSAIAAAPAVADFHNNLGLALKSSQPSDRASTAFSRAAALQPDLAFAWLNLASTTVDIARRRSLQRSLALDPSNTEALLGLAGEMVGTNQRAPVEQALLRRQVLLGRPPRARQLRILAFDDVISSGRGRIAAELATPFSATYGGGTSITVPLRAAFLRDAVVGSDGLPILDDGILLEDCIADREALPFLSTQVTPLGDHHLASHHAPVRSGLLPDAFLLGGGPNYYHWIADYLPRLMACETLGFTGPILIGSGLSPVQIDTIAKAGIDPARLVALDGAPIQVRHLIVPSVAARATVMHPAAIEWLRRRFLPPAATSGGNPIYISRQGAKHRRLVNEPQLIQELVRLGFEIVELERMSVDRQVASFHGAPTVIGAHGAGLVNLIFSSTPCRLIELDADGSARSFYSTLASQLGCRYHRVSVRAATPHMLQHSDIVLTGADIDRIVTLAGSAVKRR